MRFEVLMNNPAGEHRAVFVQLTADEVAKAVLEKFAAGAVFGRPALIGALQSVSVGMCTAVSVAFLCLSETALHISLPAT